VDRDGDGAAFGVTRRGGSWAAGAPHS